MGGQFGHDRGSVTQLGCKSEASVWESRRVRAFAAFLHPALQPVFCGA